VDSTETTPSRAAMLNPMKAWSSSEALRISGSGGFAIALPTRVPASGLIGLSSKGHAMVAGLRLKSGRTRDANLDALAKDKGRRRGRCDRLASMHPFAPSADLRTVGRSVNTISSVRFRGLRPNGANGANGGGGIHIWERPGLTS